MAQHPRLCRRTARARPGHHAAPLHGERIATTWRLFFAVVDLLEQRLLLGERRWSPLGDLNVADVGVRSATRSARPSALRSTTARGTGSAPLAALGAHPGTRRKGRVGLTRNSRKRASVACRSSGWIWRSKASLLSSSSPPRNWHRVIARARRRRPSRVSSPDARRWRPGRPGAGAPPSARAPRQLVGALDVSDRIGSPPPAGAHQRRQHRPEDAAATLTTRTRLADELRIVRQPALRQAWRVITHG